MKEVKTLNQKKRVKSLILDKQSYNLVLEKYYAFKDKKVTPIDNNIFYSKTYLNSKAFQKSDVNTFLLKIPLDVIYPCYKKEHFLVYKGSFVKEKDIYFTPIGLVPIFTTLKAESYGKNLEVKYICKEQEVKLIFKIYFKKLSIKAQKKIRLQVMSMIDSELKDLKNQASEDKIYKQELLDLLVTKKFQKKLLEQILPLSKEIKNLSLIKYTPFPSRL